MKKVIFVVIVLFINQLTNGQKYTPLITKDSVVIDTFFNKYIVEDKYRWLENTTSKEVIDWTESQSKLSKNYLVTTSNNTNSFKLIDRYAYTKYKYSKKKGDYYFSYAYFDNQSVPALFIRTALKDDLELLVDPNYISKNDLIQLKGYSVSNDSQYLAYQFCRNGSDLAEVKIVTLPNGIHTKDHLTGLKYSNIAWLKDGFFYSTFQESDKFGIVQGEKVFYHKLGSEQQDDKVIFYRDDKSMQFHYTVTSDERYFIIKELNKEKGYANIFFIDYQSENPTLKPLLMKQKVGIEILDSKDGKLIAKSTLESNNNNIVEIDPNNPYKWREIVPEYSQAVLLDIIPFKDRIVTLYQSNQRPIVTLFDYSGTTLYSLEFPMATSVSGFSGNWTDNDLLFSFQSYTVPPVIYNFNIKTFQKTLSERTTINFDYSNIEYKEVEYLSNDSVAIPMILVYEKGLKLDGSNPTVLSAYGGFGSVVQPHFNPGIVYFIKQGGVYAFANIRGGGDKGVSWAKSGCGDNKQQSFDDFIAGAEYLIKNKYTNSQKLATTGSSNGGLVVATAAIQRPDLFKVVVPVVAPLDMIRFENFTVGNFHTNEYGTIKDSVSFSKLYNYSPYNNIKENINYPAMLVITSDNDDRVPPLHSFKFVAKLQSRDAQKNPILLKIEKNAGHYGASTLTKYIREYSDIFGFILNELNKKSPEDQ
ncbi:MAG: prolyl oligopeptidase family serine peptidase [Bacteroidales bacterium]